MFKKGGETVSSSYPPRSLNRTGVHYLLYMAGGL